jgi:hypothetical protein
MNNYYESGGMVKVTSCKKLFSRKKPAMTMKSAVNFSYLLFSEQFIITNDKMNIQGDNSVEYCI